MWWRCRVVGSAVLIRAVCGSKGRFGAVIFAGVFGGGFVFPAIRFGVGIEKLNDESSLIAIEVAYVGQVFLGVLFEWFHG